jgi:hypothetical protein
MEANYLLLLESDPSSISRKVKLSYQSHRSGWLPLLLKLLRTDKAYGRMTALAVIPDGEPFKQRRPCFCSCRK